MTGTAHDEIVRFIYEITGDKDLAATAATMVKVGSSGADASAEVIKFTDALKAAAANAKLVNDALSQKAGVADLKTQYETAVAALSKLNAEFDRTDTSSKKITKAFSDAEKQVATLSTKLNEQEVALQKSEGALQKAGVDTSNLAAANTKLHDEANAAVMSLGKIGEASATASTGTSKLASAANTVKDSFVKVTEGVGAFIAKAAEITGITGIITSLIAAISGFKFFSAGAEEAANFDQALGKLRATTTLTAAEFEALKTRIETTATALDMTATDGAIAAGKLAASFGDANKAVEALPATLQLAKAAQIDVATAADIVATSLKAFGLAAGDAGQVADVLATVALKTGQDLTTLSSTFAQLAPFAKAVGLSFTDTASILGVLASKGIDSEKALGGLRILFEDLRNPTSNLRQELVGLGIDTSSFASIMAGLANAGPKAEAALDSLGVKGKAAILALVQDGGAGLRAFQGDLGDTAGAAKTAGDKIENDLLHSFLELGNVIKNTLGNLLGGALDPIKNEVQSLTDRIKAIPESAGFQSIKQAIFDFAEWGVSQFEKLLRSIDFKKASQNIADFIDGAEEKFGSLSKTLKVFGNAALVVVNTVAALFQGLTAAIYGVAGAFEKTVEIAIKGSIALSGQFSALQNPATELAIIVKAFGDSADEAFAKAKAASLAAASSMERVANAATGASGAFDNVKGDADSTAPAIEEVGKSADAATTGLDAAAESGGKAAASLNKVGASAELTGKALAQANFDKATADLDALQKSSTLTAAELDKAQLAVFTTAQALKQFSPESQKAAGALADLKTAFAVLSVSSQQSLQEVADKAKNAFNLIDQASAQTAAGLADRRTAFLAYAQAAVDAAAKLDEGTKLQVQSDLEAKAAALGVLDALAKIEQQGFKAGDAVAQGLDKAKASADAAKVAIDAVAYSTSAAAIAADSIGKAAKASEDAFNKVAAAGGGVIALTEESSRALAYMNDILNRTGTIANVSLADAKYLLHDLGLMAGAQTQVLTQRIAELEQAAQQAVQTAARMADEAASLQDQIDQLQGNQTDIEDRRHAKALADMKAEAEAQGTLNSAAYSNLVNLENQLHDLKMKDQRDQAAASAAAAKSSAATTAATAAAQTANPPGSGSLAPATQRQAIDFTFNGTSMGGINVNDNASMTQLAQKLLPKIIDALKAAARQTGGFSG